MTYKLILNENIFRFLKTQNMFKVKLLTNDLFRVKSPPKMLHILNETASALKLDQSLPPPTHDGAPSTTHPFRNIYFRQGRFGVQQKRA